MADQVVLKHLREAIGKVPLHRLEIELRLNGQLSAEAFGRLEKALAGTDKWESVRDSNTCDRSVGDVRVTDGAVAVRKHRLQTSDAGLFRVSTADEEPVAAPPPGAAGFQRVKQRRERSFFGWKLALTIVNPACDHPGYEVEVELDNLWLVRQPLEVLAKTGTGLMEDVVGLVR